MGRTLLNLATSKLDSKPIFNNRFVVEICEKVHIHYRNLRIVQDLNDWIKFSEGMRDSLERWKKKGSPECSDKTHVELTRKNIAISDKSDEILINLNQNLYVKNEGRIFSEGAEFKDDKYIHLKIRDLRLELSINEFLLLADAVRKADQRIKGGYTDPVLQKT